MQILYEGLRAENLGERALQPFDTKWRNQWERVGLLGLFSAEDVQGGLSEPTLWIRLQEATDMSEAGRQLVEAYRILIEKSLTDRFPRRSSHEVTSPLSRDLREGVLSSSA